METFRIRFRATERYIQQVANKRKLRKEETPYFIYHTQRQKIFDVSNPEVEYDLSALNVESLVNIVKESKEHFMNKGKWDFVSVTRVNTFMPTLEQTQEMIVKTTNMFQVGLI